MGRRRERGAGAAGAAPGEEGVGGVVRTAQDDAAVAAG